MVESAKWGVDSLLVVKPGKTHLHQSKPRPCDSTQNRFAYPQSRGEKFISPTITFDQQHRSHDNVTTVVGRLKLLPCHRLTMQHRQGCMTLGPVTGLTHDKKNGKACPR
jgi:hypothetical protein